MSFVVSMLLVFSVTTIGSAAIDQGASTTNSSNGAAFLANAPSPPNNTVAVPVSALHTNNSAALVTISDTADTAAFSGTVQEGSTSLCTSTGTFSCTSITATAAGQGTSSVFIYIADTAASTNNSSVTPSVPSQGIVMIVIAFLAAAIWSAGLRRRTNKKKRLTNSWVSQLATMIFNVIVGIANATNEATRAQRTYPLLT